MSEATRWVPGAVQSETSRHSPRQETVSSAVVSVETTVLPVPAISWRSEGIFLNLIGPNFAHNFRILIIFDFQFQVHKNTSHHQINCSTLICGIDRAFPTPTPPYNLEGMLHIWVGDVAYLGWGGCISGLEKKGG
jgi:hypothetical protein